MDWNAGSGIAALCVFFAKGEIYTAYTAADGIWIVCVCVCVCCNLNSKKLA